MTKHYENVQSKSGDKKILALTSRDIVTAEAHYHVSCYKDFTRILKKEPDNKEKAEETVADELYKSIEREAYNDLFTYIRTYIFSNKMIIQITSLVTKFELSCHLVELQSCEILCGMLMVPESVSLRNVELKIKLHRGNSMFGRPNQPKKIIDQNSSRIRSIIRRKMTVTRFPFYPSDVKEITNISIPEELDWLLVGLLTGNHDSKTQTQRVTALVQSFSQDIIYAVTCGLHKPPNTFYLLMQ